jgi:Holliday junction resolvase
MPSKSKSKGNRFERLVVAMTKDQGIDAIRAYGSNGQSLGHHEEVDVLINKKIKIQCKSRKKIARWMMPNENVDIQVIKEDRGVPYAVLPYDDYLELIKGDKNE